MKFFAVCALTAGLAQMATAQADSLVDVLPLAVGNSWHYYFYTQFVSSTSHTTTTRQGPEEFQIIETIPGADSTTWRFRQKRTVTTTTSSGGGSYVTTSQDSAIIDLVEMNSGQHALYTPLYDQNSLFPFMRTSADSMRFFRYRIAPAVGNLTDTLNAPNANVGFDQYYFTLQPNTGIVHVQCNRFGGFPSSSSSMQHDLLDFAPTGILPVQEIPPPVFALSQNYPNPFNPSTKIRYSIAYASPVTLVVYNVLGQEIATLVNERQGVGPHEVEFHAEGFPSGMYIYRLRAGEFTQTRKLVIVR